MRNAKLPLSLTLFSSGMGRTGENFGGKGVEKNASFPTKIIFIKAFSFFFSHYFFLSFFFFLTFPGGSKSAKPKKEKGGRFLDREKVKIAPVENVIDP